MRAYLFSKQFINRVQYAHACKFTLKLTLANKAMIAAFERYGQINYRTNHISIEWSSKIGQNSSSIRIVPYLVRTCLWVFTICWLMSPTLADNYIVYCTILWCTHNTSTSCWCLAFLSFIERTVFNLSKLF